MRAVQVTTLDVREREAILAYKTSNLLEEEEKNFGWYRHKPSFSGPVPDAILNAASEKLFPAELPQNQRQQAMEVLKEFNRAILTLCTPRLLQLHTAKVWLVQP